MPIRKVALIEPKASGIHLFTRWKLPRLGLPILGAMLKKMGIEATVHFEEATQLDWEDILSSDLVGISSIVTTADQAYVILNRIKQESSIPIVMGGPHVTFLPEEALGRGADFVVRGEGEETLPELIHYLEGQPGSDLSNIKGLSYRVGDEFRHNPDRPLIEDLSSLPWPDFSLMRNYRHRMLVPVLTSRGCPFHCNFCQVTLLFGRGFRFRSTEDILSELKDLYSKDPRKTFFFYDDNFTANRMRTKELLSRMLEEKVTPRWTAMTRVDVIEDEELLGLMRKSGCGYVYIGLESVNPETLKSYRKGQTVEDIARAVKVLHKYGIRVHGMFMAGADEDETRTAMQTVRFAKRVGIDSMHFTLVTPLPGTDFWNDLEAENRIFDFNWPDYDGMHVVFHPRNMSPGEVQREALVKAMRKFYTLRRCLQPAFALHGIVCVHRIYGRWLVEQWWKHNREQVERLEAGYERSKASVELGRLNAQPSEGEM